jgi:hypothetical protein
MIYSSHSHGGTLIIWGPKLCQGHQAPKFETSNFLFWLNGWTLKHKHEIDVVKTLFLIDNTDYIMLSQRLCITAKHINWNIKTLFWWFLNSKVSNTEMHFEAPHFMRPLAVAYWAYSKSGPGQAAGLLLGQDDKKCMKNFSTGKEICRNLEEGRGGR